MVAAETKTIEKAWVFLAVTPAGEEGIVAVLVAGAWTPLFTTKQHLLKPMAQDAKSFMADTGHSVRCVEFSQRKDVTEEVMRDV